MLALHYHYEYGFHIITNDMDSFMDEMLPEGCVLKLQENDRLPDIPESMNVVFDAGKGVNSQSPILIEAIQRADKIIMPCTYGDDEVKRMKRAVQQLGAINPNIIVISNPVSQTEQIGKKEAEELYQSLKEDMPYPVFKIKRSNYLGELHKKAESLSEKYNRGGLTAYHMENLMPLMNALDREL